MKIISGPTAQERAQLELLLDAAEDLDPHKNVVQHFYHDTWKGNMRVFMRLYDLNLKDVIDEFKTAEQRIDVLTVAKIAADVAQGLAFLHKNDIIHRGLKEPLQPSVGTL